MDKPLLNDKLEYPDDTVLGRYLGKTKPIWDEFVSRLSSNFAVMSLEWKFYNDGKAWLCKLVHKKKTVCWISVWDQYFKTAFYFTEKYDKEIDALNIASTYKESYKTNKSYGKLKPLIIDAKTRKSLDSIYELIQFKSKIV
jgi:beta-galactosidase GanA